MKYKCPDGAGRNVGVRRRRTTEVPGGPGQPVELLEEGDPVPKFAEQFGTDLKALIPVAGDPMVCRPVRALLATKGIGKILVFVFLVLFVVSLVMGRSGPPAV